MGQGTVSRIRVAIVSRVTDYPAAQRHLFRPSDLLRLELQEFPEGPRGHRVPTAPWGTRDSRITLRSGRSQALTRREDSSPAAKDVHGIRIDGSQEFSHSGASIPEGSSLLTL